MSDKRTSMRPIGVLVTLLALAGEQRPRACVRTQRRDPPKWLAAYLFAELLDLTKTFVRMSSRQRKLSLPPPPLG